MPYSSSDIVDTLDVLSATNTRAFLTLDSLLLSPFVTWRVCLCLELVLTCIRMITNAPLCSAFLQSWYVHHLSMNGTLLDAVFRHVQYELTFIMTTMHHLPVDVCVWVHASSMDFKFNFKFNFKVEQSRVPIRTEVMTNFNYSSKFLSIQCIIFVYSLSNMFLHVFVAKRLTVNGLL